MITRARSDLTTGGAKEHQPGGPRNINPRGDAPDSRRVPHHILAFLVDGDRACGENGVKDERGSRVRKQGHKHAGVWVINTRPP